MIDLEQEFEQLMVELYEGIRQKQTVGKLTMSEANDLAMLVKQRTGYDALGKRQISLVAGDIFQRMENSIPIINPNAEEDYIDDYDSYDYGNGWNSSSVGC